MEQVAYLPAKSTRLILLTVSLGTLSENLAWRWKHSINLSIIASLENLHIFQKRARIDMNKKNFKQNKTGKPAAYNQENEIGFLSSSTEW